jgi:hypothetical protein
MAWHTLLSYLLQQPKAMVAKSAHIAKCNDSENTVHISKKSSGIINWKKLLRLWLHKQDSMAEKQTLLSAYP